jgi:hypothetical protein
MNSESAKFCNEVTADEISALLEMDIDAGRRDFIESHISRCELCRSEINFQKRFLNSLGSTLQTELSPNLPKDFAKVVKTRAEVGVEKARNPGERRRALLIIAMISLFILFGMLIGKVGFLPVAREIAVIGLLVLHFFGEIATAFMVFGSFAKSQIPRFSFSILWFGLIPFTLLLILFARRKITKLNSGEARSLD